MLRLTRFAPPLVQAVKVNSLGKWKTALQMVSMSLLLVARQPALLPPGAGTGEGVFSVTCLFVS